MKTLQKLCQLLLNDPAWNEGSATRVCLIAMISVASRENGLVDASYSHIAHISGVSIEEAKAAFLKMENLDQKSYFRLVKHGTSWVFPGFKRVLRMLSGTQIKRNRSTSRGIGGFVYYARYKDHIKIGFSMNPWSRIRELSVKFKGIKLEAYERGTYAREKFRHKQFERFNTQGEWFLADESLESLIKNIQQTKLAE